MFKVNKNSLDGTVKISRLKPAGVIDPVGAESLLNKIQSDLKVGKRTFYIDFTAVDSLDEQGIEPLLQGLKIITDTGGQGYLLSLNDEVRSLFVSRDLHLILNVLP